MCTILVLEWPTRMICGMHAIANMLDSLFAFISLCVVTHKMSEHHKNGAHYQVCNSNRLKSEAGQGFVFVLNTNKKDFEGTQFSN